VLRCELEDYLADVTNVAIDEGFMARVQGRINLAPDHSDRPEVMFRASKIGRPWVLQTLERWYGGKKQLHVKSCLAMMLGNVAQEAIAELVEMANFGTVTQELELKHMGVCGHADLVIERGGEVLVCEIKTMAPHLITPFRNAPSDDYGYVSQLSFYIDCLRRLHPTKKVEGCFILYDAANKKFYVVGLTEMAISSRVERYHQMVPLLTRLTPYDVEGLLAISHVPPTVNGKLPNSVKFTRWAEFLYVQDALGKYSVRSNADISLRLLELKNRRADGELLHSL
jgi:hypothetical protein